MLTRALLWLAIGLALGLIATAAGLAPARWGSRRWLAASALGASVALVGGLLASIILDDIFATYAAILLPIAVIGVVALLARWRSVGG